jgi:hypothetical protein
VKTTPQKDQARRWACMCRRMMEREVRRLGIERFGKEPMYLGLMDQLVVIREYERLLKCYPTLGLWHDPSQPLSSDMGNAPPWSPEGTE